MRYDEFVGQVRRRGGYADETEAAVVTQAVLGVLGHRLDEADAEELGCRLPLPMGMWLTGDGGPSVPIGTDEFLQRVGIATGVPPETAETDARAVLRTVAAAVSATELDAVLARLPAGYAALFGQNGDHSST
ncbi:DUF2267 domain-containing protein [Melissospora conviva]|uniref:DUF2267 domain-containing protein n=1 Tax=Melissospora conviva TaxID=3388432 RepID=UPI003B7D080B